MKQVNFEYDGVKGTAVFSRADRCWWGEVLLTGTRHLITYEAETCEDLMTAFAKAVEDSREDGIDI